jgi:uncharacterized membrane-anchored protein YitT (DUF2179 family)
VLLIESTFMPLRRALGLALAYLQLTAGAICIALSLDLFLIPNDVVSGGLTGVAQILHTLFGTPVGVVSLLMNIPLFVLGWRYLGGLTFGARTLYATIALSVAIDLLAPLAQRFSVDEPLLYVFYGGFLDGIGLGLVFRALGTTGGIDIIARFLQQWRGLRMGQSILILSALIFALAGWIYGATQVLYALLVAYISGRVVDVVLEGFSYARSALIISNKPDDIRAALLHDLGRGVTTIEGRGGYTSEDRPVLLCVLAQSEISLLKSIVSDVDPGAFVVITEAAEVLGEGFKAVRPH